MEVVRRRRLTRGEPHAAVESTLREAGHLTGLAALALFDDVERAGEVLERLQREAGAPLAAAFRRCDESGEIPPADAVDLVRLASKLTAWLRGLS
jgi:hypothetical protein